MIAILGVLKSGAAYVPVDPGNPEERTKYMLSDCSCKLLIDEHELIQFAGVENDHSGLNPELVSKPSDLVYVIYTSGSTGQPKGVMIRHESLIDYIYGVLERTNIRECRSFGLVSTIAADLGNTVIYASLTTGGELHLFPAAAVMNPAKMARVKLDCIKIVPSHWKALQEEGKVLTPGKCLIFGGEQLTRDVTEMIRLSDATCKVYNHYGPSETTVGKLLQPIDLSVPDYRISLGYPLGNSRVYILDKHNKWVPMGVTGEICIGGVGLSAGYLNEPELTAEKFVLDPYVPGELIYRTGDLGRFQTGYGIEFGGRKDDQVKIRGFRVESGEIENTLILYPGIVSVAVLAREDGSGEKRLIAYIVSREDIDISDITAYLQNKLPAYMVPSYYIRLQKMPLTSNGKIDRRSMPLPEKWHTGKNTEYIAPRNPTEEKLAAIWSEILGVNAGTIGVKDNFFELGGHSLKAIRIVLRIHEQFGIEIDLANFFKQPDIGLLATEIENVLWLRQTQANDLFSGKTIV